MYYWIHYDTIVSIIMTLEYFLIMVVLKILLYVKVLSGQLHSIYVNILQCYDMLLYLYVNIAYINRILCFMKWFFVYNAYETWTEIYRHITKGELLF